MESGQVVAFPSRGEVFVDQRGEGRSMRLAWHTEADVVVEGTDGFYEVLEALAAP